MFETNRIMSGINVISMKSCRICLTSSRTLCPLFKYQYSGNYAEMLTGIADVKVSHNDDLPDKICAKCCTALEKAYLLKTLAESSDRKLRTFLKKIRDKAPRKKISFNSFNDVKTEIAPLVKSEPKWEMEIEVLDSAVTPPIESTEGKDIVIANTVIKKVDPKKPEIKPALETDQAEVTWSSNKVEPELEEYLDDEIFQDDVNDEDYVPPTETKKSGFKKPKLSDIKVFKDNKTVVRKIKVLRKIKDGGDGRSTMITCYPIMKNGSRGAPILLKRPKDATVLKVHSNYKSKDPSYVSRESKSLEGTRVVRREKTARVLRLPKPVSKQKEKLVCPVCGILTFTLGNHMTTHQEKKRYSCPDCTRTFAQKGNLQIHQKQHTGIKDHICEICGAGFYSQKSLVRHNLIHKGERPYPCNLCNKKFIARCDLNRHLRIHSGYKPYKCATCAMSFNAKHQLQNHERMHTGERPYTCQVCNVAFSYKVNLNNHVFKVHGVNLKFKSIHTVTEDVLRAELGLANEARAAISHIIGEMAQADEAENENVAQHEFKIL